MKEARGDRVVDLLNERFSRIKQRLAKDYKGVKPFRMEPIDDDSLLYIYDRMTPQAMNDAIKTYGPDVVNQRIGDMETLKSRRQKNA